MKFPSARKFLRSAWTAFQFFLKTGKVRVAPATAAARQTICKACPHSTTGFFKSESFRQCQICTCLTEPKSQLITETCPKNLWPR